MINRPCNSSTSFISGLPLANRLEKSVSVRLKRASLPLLSQDSRFLAVRSLKELTILLLSSRLLFFCKNPKRLQEEEVSAAWLHSLYILRQAAFFFYYRPIIIIIILSYSFSPSHSLLLFASLPLSYTVLSELFFLFLIVPSSMGNPIYGRRECVGGWSRVTSAPNSSQAKTNRCHVAAVNSYESSSERVHFSGQAADNIIASKAHLSGPRW